MHETSIAIAIHRAAREAVERGGGGRIEVVRVAVGDRAGVDPELLRFAWEAVVAETPEPEATLEIRWCETRRHCPRCGQEKPEMLGIWLPLCPSCESPLRLSGGEELDLLRVEYEPFELSLTRSPACEGEIPS